MLPCEALAWTTHAKVLRHISTTGSTDIGTVADEATALYLNTVREAVCLPLAALAISLRNVQVLQFVL